MKKMLWLLIAVMVFTATPLMGSSVETMNKDELKALLGSEDLVILDVRTGRDWSTSEFKIQGAVRPEGDVVAVAGNYTKDHTFVLYCA
jgi:rhodanese-related sulfurtransferase